MKNIYKKKNHIEKLVKDTNRNFKEETQMSNKHIKYVIRELQIKNTIKYHTYPPDLHK